MQAAITAALTLLQNRDFLELFLGILEMIVQRFIESKLNFIFILLEDCCFIFLQLLHHFLGYL